MKIIVMAIIAAIWASSCCKTCPPPQTVVVEKAGPPCLTSDPPPVPAISHAGPAEGCPTQWEACLAKSDADQLLLYLRLTKLWIDGARDRCGKIPAVK